MAKPHNFYAGPAILPQSVIEDAANAIHDFAGTGLSILEVSHRSKEVVQFMEAGVAAVRQLLDLSDDYAVLYLTGGASSQFFMTAMNLLPSTGTAALLDTGTWSTKTIKEHRLFGKVDVVASSKDKNFSYIPKGYDIPTDATYMHITTNNTIFGTELHELPDTDLPFVADMSSNIFSRPIDVERFGLIYSGAQKNLGPAGSTLVIVRKDLLGKVDREIPTMLDYRTHIKKDSAFNTPPVYPIYVLSKTLQWIVDQGGLKAMDQHNTEKAQLLYDEIDRNGLFEGTVAKEDRSRMNACFLLKDDSRNEAFLSACKAANIIGLKGHRSVGGFRASMYNAMQKESVQTLVDVMQEFERTNG